MRQTIIFILFLSLLFSCKESSTPENIVGKQDNIQIDKSMDIDIQHSDSTEVIQTQNVEDNHVLFSKLNLDLGLEKFVIENQKSDSVYNLRYFDCDRNVNILVKGEGVRWYYIKRTEAKPKNYFPDFVLYVLEFNNENEAKLNYDKISLALISSGRFCNGKGPKDLVMNTSEVFYLTSRAEMFRGYIDDFVQKIKNYR